MQLSFLGLVQNCRRSFHSPQRAAVAENSFARRSRCSP